MSDAGGDFERALDLLDAEEVDEARALLERLARKGHVGAQVELASLDLELAGEDDAALAAAVRSSRKALASARAAYRANRSEETEDDLWAAWDLAIDAFAWHPVAADAPGLVREAGEDFPGEPLRDEVGGITAFCTGRFEDAAAHLARAAGAWPDSSRVAHWNGCALERLGRDDDARRELARAAKLDPDAFWRPVRVSAERFQECLDEALAELPELIRARIESSFVLAVEDFPRADDVRSGIDPLSLGLFRGPHVGDLESVTSGPPPEIVVFKKNLEKACKDEDELVEEIRVTLFHEVGHALGFDEDGVDELGLH